MTDTEFADALERGELAKENFHHLSHLRVAWAYLLESATVEEAAARMRKTLQKFTATAGQPEKYHETITQFWVRVLGEIYRQYRRESLEQILEREPSLLEKNYLHAYYSPERLATHEARTSWVEPDLKPLSAYAAPLPPSDPARYAPARPLS